MMPTYRSMDSYPFQRNQIPFPYNHHPDTDVVPPQIRMDPSKYEQHWPHAGSYGHIIPTYSCCGHNNFPSPMYCSGGYLACGEPFFIPYHPQPHYTMELPRYGYDKYMTRDHHCCGCPNHPCNQKEGISVKIEEHEPDVGKKANDASLPASRNYYPYPLVWIPSEYTGNKQLKNPTIAEAGEQDKKPHGPENLNADVQPAQEPRVWNGWLPFDMKGVPNMIHGEDGVRSQNKEKDHNRRESEDGRMNQKHQSEDKRSEFPFPIFWLPYYDKQEEGGRTNNQNSNSTPKYIEEVPHTLKTVPVKSYVDEGVTNSRNAPNVVEKITNERSIPVKQMELHRNTNDSEGSEKNVTKKDSHTNSKRRSTSPPKASKLPLVCLRVDPPRKKNGNGSSRSSSPPALKEHSQATTEKTSKTPSSGMTDKAKPSLSHPSAANTSERVAPKVRTIHVFENKTSENKGAGCRDECQTQISKPSGVPTGTTESDTYGDRSKTEEKNAEKTGEAIEQSVKDTTTPFEEGGKKEGRALSDADAAVLIQAAYRGYQVRKWEPLKKLKQIAEVSKEVTDVRGRIQAFEDSSDLQNDEKQRIAIGETIMRLLLKLDTIQGLHPSFREIRKSLAKELVTLQERLDSVMAKKLQQQMQEFDFQKSVEVTSQNTQDREYHQKKQEEKGDILGDSSEGISDGSHDTLVKCQLCMNDGDNNLHPKDGGSESQSPDVASSEGIDPTVLPNGSVNIEDVSPMVAIDALDSTSNLSETNKTAEECESKAEVNNIPIEVDKLDISAWKELPVGVCDEDVIDVSSRENTQNEKRMEEAMVDNSARDSVIHGMMELPVGLLDEDAVTPKFGEDEGTNISNREVQAEDVESIEELPMRLLDEETTKSEFEKHDGTNTCRGELQTENEESIEELPVGLLDEYTEKSEFEIGDSKSYKEDQPTEVEEYCNANEITGSSTTDDTAQETQLEQPLLVEQEEVQSNGESDGWGKIEFQKEDELKGNEKMCLEEELKDKPAQQETQVDDIQDMVGVHAITSADGKDTRTLGKVETHELTALTSPPSLKDVPNIVEHGAELNGDVKLLEENEKLRMMMDKLVEAGNVQLSVISDLTGRVKDLEKKLAKTRRSKRVRTKRGRPLTSK